MSRRPGCSASARAISCAATSCRDRAVDRRGGLRHGDRNHRDLDPERDQRRLAAADAGARQHDRRALPYYAEAPLHVLLPAILIVLLVLGAAARVAGGPAMTATVRVEALEVPGSTSSWPDGRLATSRSARAGSAGHFAWGETGSGESLVAQAIMGRLPTELAARAVIKLGDADLLAAHARARVPSGAGQIRSCRRSHGWRWIRRCLAGQVNEVHQPACAASAAARPRPRVRADLGEVGLGDARPVLSTRALGWHVPARRHRDRPAAGASILMADEPTKGLDGAARRRGRRAEQGGRGRPPPVHHHA